MKLSRFLTAFSLVLFTGCLTAPDDTDPTDEGTVNLDVTVDAEVIGPALYTVTPILHPVGNGINYRGALSAIQPASCGGDIDIGRVFRRDPVTGRFVETQLTVCTANLRGTLRRVGQGFDLFLE